jgi:hypothetical protein
MREQPPTSQTMKISDAKNTVSRLGNAVYRKEARVVVEKSGIPVAAIIAADDLGRFGRLERELERTLTDAYVARRLPADEATAILTSLSPGR